jgi:hypothetical protein
MLELENPQRPLLMSPTSAFTLTPEASYPASWFRIWWHYLPVQ